MGLSANGGSPHGIHSLISGCGDVTLHGGVINTNGTSILNEDVD